MMGMTMKTVDITCRYETRDTPATPRPSDSISALDRLNDGNLAFARLLDESTKEHVERTISVDSRDLGLGDAILPKQRPFAVILGCSDARVPVELIFNEGPNDLFVIRIAGNGLGTEILGSLKYAVDNLRGSLKLIAVLGHSGCGALTTAVDVFLDPTNYLPLVTMHSLRRILDSLLVVVRASARKFRSVFGPEISDHPRYREALIEASIVNNAALGAYSIQQELGNGDPAKLQTVYGVYLLETRQVWAPRVSEIKEIGLASAPREPAEFIKLGNAILQSDRIQSLLQL